MEYEATDVFNCYLLSSCELRSNMSEYPTRLTSGTKDCLPEAFKRRRCMPGCRNGAYRPGFEYCHGRCLYNGQPFSKCYFHPCSPVPYRQGSEKGCAEQVSLLLDDDDGDDDVCKPSCSNIETDTEAATCQSCLQNNLPDPCKLVSGESCWYCTNQVHHAELKCSERNPNDFPAIIRCIKNEKIYESCQKCVCTLLCYLLPGSELCKACLQSPEFASMFLNHKHCDQGWVWSESASKCYKAYSSAQTMQNANFLCMQQNTYLAEPKTDSITATVNEAINRQATPGEYWVGGAKNDNGSYLWLTDNSDVGPDSWGPGFPVNVTGKFHHIIFVHFRIPSEGTQLMTVLQGWKDVM